MKKIMSKRYTVKLIGNEVGIFDDGIKITIPEVLHRLNNYDKLVNESYSLTSVSERLNAETMQKLINDTYNWQVQDMDADTMEEALKLGIREGVLSTRDLLTNAR